jgi:hypothetical protein
MDGRAGMAKLTMANDLETHLKWALAEILYGSIHWNERAYFNVQSRASGEQRSSWIPQKPRNSLPDKHRHFLNL